MRINNNLMAMNTHRQLGVANAGGAKSMEKLSSGMRINRAGDDAAGLAISEKMRGQIRGLNQASSNAQDGISMIQTAEGALNETHAIIQRMRELAVQSSTDTNTNEDRAKIQGEVDQLAKEITRISNTTEFNTQNLMAGGMSSKFHIGANEGQDVSFSINAMDASSLGIAGDAKVAGAFTDVDTGITGAVNPGRGLVTGKYTLTTVITPAEEGTAAQVDNIANAGNAAAALEVTNYDKFTGDKDTSYMVKVAAVDKEGGAVASQTNDVTGISYSTDNGQSWKTVAADAGVATIDGMTFTFATSTASDADNNNNYAVGDSFSFSATAAKGTVTLTDPNSKVIGGVRNLKNSDTRVQVGENSDGKTVDLNIDFSKLTSGTATFEINETKSKAATVNGSEIDGEAIAAVGIDVSSQANAAKAITKINDALERVSEERSKMGAIQNRLEHTIKNLDTSAENLQASEARIRDVDMAKEMMEQTKQNILAQASTAMLANANQAPQAVLQLLR